MTTSQVLKTFITPLITDAYPGMYREGECDNCLAKVAKSKYTIHPYWANAPSFYSIYSCSKPECMESAKARNLSLKLTLGTPISLSVPVWIIRSNGILDKDDANWEVNAWKMSRDELHIEVQKDATVLDPVLGGDTPVNIVAKRFTFDELIECNAENPNKDNIIHELYTKIREMVTSFLEEP